jgi:diazepam-binding inhibitor (GABA receptor modulating acyl-CoA-binding protein)
MTTEERFTDAQERIKTISSASTDTLLELYALYKQGTTGDVQGSRPGFTDIKGRKKFDAWTSRKGLSKDQAMIAYVDLVDSLMKK